MNKRYTLYLDESGIASLTDYKDRCFVVSGIVVEDSADIELSAYFNYIKRAHKLPESKSFHSVDFFENKKSDLYLKDSKCIKFCQSVAEFIKIAPFNIAIVCLDKRHLRELIKMPNGYSFKGSKDHKEDKEIGYEILTRKVFLEFAKFIKIQKAKGSVVAESRRESDRVILKSFLQSQDSEQFKRRKNLSRYSFEMRNRVVSLCFENKNGLRGGLEMSDLFAYVYYQKINRKIPLLKKRGLPVLWKSIEKKAEQKQIAMLGNRDFLNLAYDRIHKIANRINQRMNEYSDFVNPTQGQESTSR